MSNQEISLEAEIQHSSRPFASALQRRASSLAPARASNPLRGKRYLREAVLLCFCDPLPEQCLRLGKLSRAEWQRLLHWLDVSGLALYFLDRLVELGRYDMVPSFVLARLQQNKIDNTKRTHGMIAESVAIQREFQSAGLTYAVLKGVSLCPDSVPRPDLRHQFDLDYLVAEKSGAAAKEILIRRGYRLYATSGRSWEFKLNERPAMSMKDFYKDQPGMSVELHIEMSGGVASSMLERAEVRSLSGVNMPVLSRVDLFLGQGLHVYKDVCGELCRAAHLLEFRRHVLARRDDISFWKELQSFAGDNPRAYLGLGVATQLITDIMGEFAPEAFTAWTTNRLPPSVRLWTKLYGRDAVFSDVPGSKLYLMLQKELEAAGLPGKRSVKKSLLPSRLPPLVMRARTKEALSIRLRRYTLQVSFLFSRLRFHVVEGLRYAWESRRWRLYLKRLPS